LKTFEIYIVSVSQTIRDLDFGTQSATLSIFAVLYFDIFGDTRSDGECAIAKYFKMVVIRHKHLKMRGFICYIFDVKSDDIFGLIEQDVLRTHCKSRVRLLHTSMI